MTWREALSKLILRLMRDEKEPEPRGYDIFAKTGGEGYGVSPDSPCELHEALAIMRFLATVNPETRNRIILRSAWIDGITVIPDTGDITIDARGLVSGEQVMSRE